MYVTHGMRTRTDVKRRELLLQATTYSILIVDISLEKYTKKVERKKKTIKRNKYFREIKGSIKTVSVIFLFYFSFFHRAKERNNSIATI